MAAEVTIGIDVGGTKLLGIALDDSGHVLADVRAPTPDRGRLGETGRSAPEFFADSVGVVVDKLRTELARVGPSAGAVPDITGFGIGMPGLVDDQGVILFAPNLLMVSGFDITAVLSERFDFPRTVVENDATSAAAGELAYGAAFGATHAVMVTLGTGIGGGLIANGEVVRGAHGFGGEIGHMVVDPSGPNCPCGRRGCWERYASGSGLGRLARDAAHAGHLAEVMSIAGGDPEAVRGEHVTEAAKGGDPEAQAVLDELAWWVALGLANLANALDPELFVIGGGLVEAFDLMVTPLRQALDEMVEGGASRPPVGLAVAALGERAGAIGAAVLARHGSRHESAKDDRRAGPR